MREFEYLGRKYTYDGEHLYSARGAKLSGKYRHFRDGKTKKTLQVAVVIWEGVFGKVPDGYVVDHEDGNFKNNQLTNLRVITHAENMKNKGGYRTQSGVPGVQILRTKSGVRYRSGIRNPQTSKCFDTLEEAIAFRDECYKLNGFHANHRRR